MLIVFIMPFIGRGVHTYKINVFTQARIQKNLTGGAQKKK